MMRRMMVGAAVALAVASIVSSPAVAKALAIRVNVTPAERVLNSDTIVVGKVQALEDKPVKVGDVEYTIAVIKVEAALAGAKDLTHVRVGFPTGTPAPAVDQPVPLPGNKLQPAVLPAIGRIRRPGIGGVQQSLAANQEGCFFLAKAPMKEAEFLVLTPFTPYLPKGDNFEKELDAVKACLATLDNPAKALKAKSEDDRLTAATFLLQKFHRAPADWQGRQEPIDAEINKLILTTLVEADWGKTDPNTGAGAIQTFHNLGVTPQDGFPKPGVQFNTPDAFPKAAKEWLKENVDKFKIKQYVAGKPEGQPQPGVGVPVPLPAQPLPGKVVPLPAVPPAAGGIRIAPAVLPAQPPVAVPAPADVPAPISVTPEKK